MDRRRQNSKKSVEDEVYMCVEDVIFLGFSVLFFWVFNLLR